VFELIVTRVPKQVVHVRVSGHCAHSTGPHAMHD